MVTGVQTCALPIVMTSTSVPTNGVSAPVLTFPRISSFVSEDPFVHATSGYFPGS